MTRSSISLAKAAAFFLVFLFFMNAEAQTHSLPIFTEEVRQNGYLHQNDTTYFVFDALRYGRENVEKVVVTGAFRGWDQNMNDPQWLLKPINGTGQLWYLPVVNRDMQTIPPSSPFKFRINEGAWLDPFTAAPNAEGGNLIFMKGMTPPALKATLNNKRAIYVKVQGEGLSRPLDPHKWVITDVKGRLIPIREVLPLNANDAILVPAEDLNRKKVYYVNLPSLKMNTWADFEGWWRDLYSDKPLGATIHEARQSTHFGLFAPRADAVTLFLYRNATDEMPYQKIPMTEDENGVWETTQTGSLKGVWYMFWVQGVEIPGFPSDHLVSDPYARVQDGSFGKSRVWPATKPASVLKKGIPKMEDVVAYEVHVQDFTTLLPVAPELRGTIPAMIRPGLKNKKGAPIGFDHLVKTGINTVHLMPMQEYLHYPDAVWKEAFQNDPLMKELGVSEENYQWGYRITHFMAIESKYRQKNTEPGTEREQFRDLVQAFHHKDMAVIVDFVFNHTGENMEGNHWAMNFNGIDMLYYYRTKDFRHIGGYGNETKSENRPMVQRWLIDQCKMFRDEFGVDGIRIDLAGMTDEQSLYKIKQAMGPDWIIYGEPWISPNDPEFRKNPDWDWYKADSPITYFQDDARNAFKGPTSDPNNKYTDRGFAGGNAAERDRTMLALTNGFPEEGDPNRGLNYLDIHDNWALADQFATKDWDGRKGVDEGAYKIAATLLFTSLGPIVIHGGTEFMRSKGAMPDSRGQVIKETRMGKIYLKGRGDTYNALIPNLFVWDNVGKSPKDDKACNCDFKGMQAYWEGLTRFRLSEKGKVFRFGGKVPPPNYYQFIKPENPYLLGYVVKANVLVLVNTAEVANRFQIEALPAGNWRLIADGQQVDFVNGLKGASATLNGGKVPEVITVPATTAMIWVKD